MEDSSTTSVEPVGRRRTAAVLTAVAVLVAVLLPSADPAGAAAPTSTAPGAAGTVVLTPADADGPDAVRFYGANRADTAALVARHGFPDADTVIIARQDDFPDSLGGGFLAGQFDAPIILTGSIELSTAARAAIDDLAPSRAIILGGAGAVGAGIEAGLRAEGLQVDRVAGDNRYETGAAIATAAGTAVGLLDGQPTAILASGTNFPDALVMSALAHARGWPLLLTGRDALPTATAQVLDDLGIQRVLVAGGEGAVSASVAAALTAGGRVVERLAGTNRVETSLAIAQFATERAGFDDSIVNVATGRSFPDALALGPLAGSDPSPVLLTNTATALGSDALATELTALPCARLVRVPGGPAAIADELMAQVRGMVAGADDCVTPTPTPTPTPTATPTATATPTDTASPSETDEPCVDDVREDDDGSGAATDVAVPADLAGVACADDANRADWFRFPAQPGQRITVSLAYAPAGGDIDFQLYGASGGVKYGNGPASGETITYDVPLGAPETTLLGVFNQTDVDSTYSLTVDVVAPSCPDDDIWEDDDSPATATLVPSPVLLHGVSCGTPGASDHFELDAAVGETVEVTLDFLHADSDLDLYLLDGNGDVLDQSIGVVNQEHITREILPGAIGPFRIWVRNLNVQDAAYVLQAEVQRATCPGDDAFEDNDVPGQDVDITPPITLRAVMCDGDTNDSDFFGLDVAAGDTINVTLTHDVSLGDLDLYLASGFSVLDQAITFGSPETIAYTMQVTDDAPVDVIVRNESDADIPYELTVTVDEVVYACPADDGYEDNDEQFTATPAASSVTIRGIVCAPDTHDWYSFDAQVGDTIDLVLDHPATQNPVEDLDLYLFSPSGAEIAGSASGVDHEEISHVVPNGSAGDWAALVIRRPGPDVPYTLGIAVTSP